MARAQPIPLVLQSSSLLIARVRKDRLPLNVGLVVGVDFAGDFKRPLQILLGTGVDHAPLLPTLAGLPS